MSTQKKPILTLTRKAAVAIAKYQAVTATGAVAAAGAEAIGCAVTDADIGDDFAVDVLGTTTALAGEVLTAGLRVEVGTAGKVVEATTGASLGITLFGAGADSPVEILIDRQPAPPTGG